VAGGSLKFATARLVAPRYSKSSVRLLGFVSLSDIPAATLDSSLGRCYIVCWFLTSMLK